MNHSKIKVGILCPLDVEYNVCKEELRLGDETERAGRFISSRKEKGIEVWAVKADVGKINCSSATQFVIDQYHPDFIIDAGVAGSLVQALDLYAIVCAEYSFEYDTSTGKTLGKIPPEDDQSFTIISKPSYKKPFQEFTNWVRETMGITIQVGNIACGEKDVKDRNFRKKLQENFKALACNWETSAVLHTANLNGVKSFSFRVISDLADENMIDTFDKNCELALQKMFPVMNEFIFNGWIQKFHFNQ